MKTPDAHVSSDGSGDANPASFSYWPSISASALIGYFIWSARVLFYVVYLIKNWLFFKSVQPVDDGTILSYETAEISAGFHYPCFIIAGARHQSASDQLVFQTRRKFVKWDSAQFAVFAIVQ